MPKSYPNILTFRTDMVIAIHENRKTMTRRTNYQRWEGVPVGHEFLVGETWKRHDGVYYYASDEPGIMAPSGIWRPGFSMPKVAARMRLRVTGFRVEQLHDITDADAKREGVGSAAEFRALWDSINGPLSWLNNPKVGVLSFEAVSDV